MSAQEIIRPSGENYSVDVVMATKYGIEEAFLIRHLQFWIRFNKNKKSNLIDGRTWSYQTLKEIADHFPFLNERKIQYALQNLEKMEVILKGNFNKSAMDKTCWYAFVNEEIYVPSLSEDSKKSYERQNCLSTNKIASSTNKIASSIPDTKPESKPLDDDDRVRGAEPPGAFEKVKNSNDIEVINTKGEKIRVSLSDIYRVFAKIKPEILNEAIGKIRSSQGPINDVFQYLKTTCENIEKRLISYDKQNEAKLNKQETKQSKEPAKITEPGIPMGPLLKQMGIII